MTQVSGPDPQTSAQPTSDEQLRLHESAPSQSDPSHTSKTGRNPLPLDSDARQKPSTQDSPRSDHLLFTNEDQPGYWPVTAEQRERMILRGVPDRHCTNLIPKADPVTPWGLCAREVMMSLTNDTAPILGIVGLRGTGKTLMAAYVTYRSVRANIPSLYTTAAMLFREIKESWQGDNGPSERAVINKFASIRVLIIDELQERAESSFEDRTLTEIIDIRYGAMQPTIIMSNLSGPDFLKSIGPSIKSRMDECGGMMLCDWKSHRG